MPVESRHLNVAKLAAALGHRPEYVHAMKKAGYVFEFPGTTTLAHAEAWLRQHLDFRSSSYFAASRAAGLKRKRQRDASAGK